MGTKRKQIWVNGNKSCVSDILGNVKPWNAKIENIFYRERGNTKNILLGEGTRPPPPPRPPSLGTIFDTKHFFFLTDNEAPYYTSCPEDKFVETTKSSERVIWKIPEFLDNSKVPPIIDHNKNSGDIFYIGEVFVYYVAKDKSNNVNDSCAFKVEVKGK